MTRNKKNLAVDTATRLNIRNIAGLTVFLWLGALLIGGIFTIFLFSIK